jgi:hypothetical protein
VARLYWRGWAALRHPSIARACVRESMCVCGCACVRVQAADPAVLAGAVLHQREPQDTRVPPAGEHVSAYSSAYTCCGETLEYCRRGCCRQDARWHTRVYLLHASVDGTRVPLKASMCQHAGCVRSAYARCGEMLEYHLQASMLTSGCIYTYHTRHTYCGEILEQRLQASLYQGLPPRIHAQLHACTLARASVLMRACIHLIRSIQS